ncbi:MAG: 30S ribosomal protein S4 [Dehalococcoidales bacterium]|nr:30S ribosomal protein S4 [Dehalococcoidales bacterium]
MARYLGSVCHLCRRCNDKLMLKGSRCMTPKCAIDRKRKAPSTRGRRRRLSERGVQLIEKQKARYSYGVFERQFRRFFAQAAKEPGVTGDNLKVILEKRLDNVVYRLGFGDSRAQSRQIVLHGHINVNGKKVSVASYMVKENDIIAVREASMKSEYFKALLEDIKSKTVPAWLTLDKAKLVGTVVTQPMLDDASIKFDGQSIVEYYSR